MNKFFTKVNTVVGQFFSNENTINEQIVMGVVFSVCLIVATFVSEVPQDKYFSLLGLVGLFFGLSKVGRDSGNGGN